MRVLSVDGHDKNVNARKKVLVLYNLQHGALKGGREKTHKRETATIHPDPFLPPFPC